MDTPHTTTTTTISGATADQPDEPRTGRRTLLRTLGAGAAGSAAGLMLLRERASAAIGTMQYGATNDATGAGTELKANRAGPTLVVRNSNTAASAEALECVGFGDATVLFAALHDPGPAGWAMNATVVGSAGYPLVLSGGQAHMLMSAAAAASGFHTAGEFLHEAVGTLRFCVAAGNPGTWRTLASQASAGAFHPISPSRVYDSRKPSPSPLTTGQSRTVSVADRIDLATGAVAQANVVPAGATAIAYNVTIVNTVGGNGFLAINEGGNNVVAASIINWSASGLTLANSSVVKLNGSRQITVICGGTGTSANFIIDVVGYYG